MADGTGAGSTQVCLLGPLTAVVGNASFSGKELGSKKARTVLGLLAAQGDALVSSDRLVDAAWPDHPPARPPAELATLVSRLRGVLGADAITGGRGAYRLDRAVVSTDIDEVTNLVHAAEARAGEPALALAAAERALALIGRGAVVADDPYAAWADGVRAEVAGLARRARFAAAAAALDTGDPVVARRHAEAAITDEPLDEHAYRLLMRAAIMADEAAAALAAYERLRSSLAETLGADPAPATQQLHMAVLQGQTPGSAGRPAAPGPRPMERLVGRDEQVASIERLWAEAVAGRAGFLVITGEAGIGKTTLAAEAGHITATCGGTVLHARCFEAERSLFLQPLVEAIGGCVAGLSASVLNDVLVERAEVLAGLVPEVAAVRPSVPAAGTSGGPGPDAGRRQAYQAVTGFVRRLARHAPVVLIVDDLHHAGLATVDLLHYLGRTLRDSRLLIITTVRSDEGRDTVARLAPVATTIELEPLHEAAVTTLVAAAGQLPRLAEILASTAGHPLFVVETLGGLAGGADGIAPSLQDSVLARVARQGHETEMLLRAAAVLGATFDPADVAALMQTPTPEVVRTCEAALRARLLMVNGREYAFTYEITRDVLYATTPEPSRYAYHLLAADLMAGRPESLATHARAVGDIARAARAWLQAGEQALRRFAAADAERLVDLALEAAAGLDQLELTARCYLARGRTRQGLADWAGALADYVATVAVARSARDLRLEMTALSELGGDTLAALGNPVSTSVTHLNAAREIAHRLGDRAFEGRICGRLAVLAGNELAFDEAIDQGLQAVALSRASGDPESLSAGLDGLKTGYAYLGQIAELAPILDELIPLARAQRDLRYLQWAVFESSFLPLAVGRWAEAAALVEEALTLARSRGGAAHEAWFLAHLGYVARLQGRMDDALEHGRRAMAAGRHAGPAHAWCQAMAAASYGTTLLRAGQAEQAADLLSSAVLTMPADHTAAYRVRFMAAIAEATGEPAARAEAEALLGSVSAPAGSAWLLGWDCYASLARAQAAAGDRVLAVATVQPLIVAARRLSWAPVLAEADRVMADLGGDRAEV